MKRFYCDHCGDEFSYADKAIQQSNRVQHLLFHSSECEKPVLVKIKLIVEAQTKVQKVEDRSHLRRHSLGDIFTPAFETQHADLCGPCRWKAIDQLRAGAPFSPPIADNILSWELTADFKDPTGD